MGELRIIGWYEAEKLWHANDHNGTPLCRSVRYRAGRIGGNSRTWIPFATRNEALAQGTLCPRCDQEKNQRRIAQTDESVIWWRRRVQ